IGNVTESCRTVRIALHHNGPRAFSMTRISRPRAGKARPEARAPIVKHNLLILGASYGSLFSTKLLMAGHRVSLVCTSPTAELINREGTVVRFSLKGHQWLLDVASKKLPGLLSATTPDEVDPGKFDLVVLGMQEAQYGLPGVRELMTRVARAG